MSSAAACLNVPAADLICPQSLTCAEGSLGFYGTGKHATRSPFSIVDNDCLNVVFYPPENVLITALHLQGGVDQNVSVKMKA
jgi:hypothetical protein